MRVTTANDLRRQKILQQAGQVSRLVNVTGCEASRTLPRMSHAHLAESHLLSSACSCASIHSLLSNNGNAWASQSEHRPGAQKKRPHNFRCEAFRNGGFRRAVNRSSSMAMPSVPMSSRSRSSSHQHTNNADRRSSCSNGLPISSRSAESRSCMAASLAASASRAWNQLRRDQAASIAPSRLSHARSSAIEQIAAPPGFRRLEFRASLHFKPLVSWWRDRSGGINTACLRFAPINTLHISRANCQP